MHRVRASHGSKVDWATDMMPQPPTLGPEKTQRELAEPQLVVPLVLRWKWTTHTHKLSGTDRYIGPISAPVVPRVHDVLAQVHFLHRLSVVAVAVACVVATAVRAAATPTATTCRLA
jgi:hypothetical protein